MGYSFLFMVRSNSDDLTTFFFNPYKDLHQQRSLRGPALTFATSQKMKLWKKHTFMTKVEAAPGRPTRLSQVLRQQLWARPSGSDGLSAGANLSQAPPGSSSGSSPSCLRRLDL